MGRSAGRAPGASCACGSPAPGPAVARADRLRERPLSVPRPRPGRQPRRGLLFLLPVAAGETLGGCFPLVKQLSAVVALTASCAWLLPAVLSPGGGAGDPLRSKVGRDVWSTEGEKWRGERERGVVFSRLFLSEALICRREFRWLSKTWETESPLHLQFRSWAHRPFFPVICSINNLDRSPMKSHLAPPKITKERNSTVGREGRHSPPLCCSAPALPPGKLPTTCLCPLHL